MSREFKVANCWKGRKLLLKMYLTEQKSCNLLPKIEKIKTKQKYKQMWEMESAKQGR